MFNKNPIIKIIFTILLGLTCLIGDRLSDNLTHAVIRAIVDNVTHALIAGLSWIIVTLLLNHSVMRNLLEITSCALMSSLIDVDHFIQAKSWKLSDATRLSKRAFLHSTTVPILLWTLMLLTSKVSTNEKMEHYSWIILMSFLSHHIRDATRRGLWFAPFGSTRPIPYYVYNIAIIILPYIFYYLMTHKIFTRKIPDYTLYQRETVDSV
ncbi:transmembrane protein C5orf28 homolog [Fopius arisanus]|uniref:Transmembrane protein 267 n=1 Tax=Fopius arisanus TaxID=64838 RepID=A0A9R1U0A1_9HYME|nr:PREDICTED: transmembrane protein C5orf28 homolog [Fopius arisanus]